MWKRNNIAFPRNIIVWRRNNYCVCHVILYVLERNSIVWPRNNLFLVCPLEAIVTVVGIDCRNIYNF